MIDVAPADAGDKTVRIVDLNQVFWSCPEEGFVL